jgi:hypothetical protein
MESLPVKGRINNYSYSSRIMHIGPGPPCDPTNLKTNGSEGNIKPRRTIHSLVTTPSLQNGSRHGKHYPNLRLGEVQSRHVSREGRQEPRPLGCGSSPRSGMTWENIATTYP